MKFLVQNLSKHAPRIGVIKEIENRPDFSIDTPTVMLHTQGGHIPHVTHEVFRLVSKEAQILQIPLVSMHVFKETMSFFQGTISEFVGSKESISCLTLHDPSSLTQQGHHMKLQVPLWTKNGKIYYDSKKYMATVEAFKPDMYYFLSDGDTNQTSSQKRVTKAVDNTITFFHECLEKHKKSEVLKKAFAMAPIAGGYDFKARQRCLDVVLSDTNTVGGYLIDGLHNNGPEVEFLPFQEIQPIVRYIIDKLPEDKMRLVQGCWNPVSIVKLVQLGVDVFDTSYCRILTERSAAMIFQIESTDCNEGYEINLRHIRYADDFGPVLRGCTCLSCSQYSRGYIHHLLSVQELLGPVLIMIHNVHHYLRFFHTIKECIKKGTLNELEARVEKQFKNHEDHGLKAKETEKNGAEVRIEEEES